MSRIGRKPVTIPKGVEVTLNGQNISAKGSKGTMQLEVNETVTVNQDGDSLSFAPVKESKTAWAMTGTMRSLVNGIVNGISTGFERKLELIGVGYRAQAKGSTLNLSLGFSHPVEYAVPEGITIETPSQTEILVKGCDKQKVGQVAANIRAYRPPEPYKGKGVRYSDEVVVRKEAKKK